MAIKTQLRVTSGHAFAGATFKAKPCMSVVHCAHEHLCPPAHKAKLCGLACAPFQLQYVGAEQAQVCWYGW